MVHARGTVRETIGEHERAPGGRREAALGLVPSTLVSRLALGAPFAAGWSVAVVVPLVRAVESDVPDALLVGALFVATITPVLLYLRRHAMGASLRWDEDTLTLLRGGRVATAIAWREATIRQRVGLGGERLVVVRDAAGRSLTLTTGAPPWRDVPEGRVRVDGDTMQRILRAARTHASFDDTRLPMPGAKIALGVVLVATIAVALFGSDRWRGAPQLAAIAFALACFALLLDPARRLHAALTRPVGRETLVIDLEERGRVRARRLDGSRVLLDLEPAHHPDALLAGRRGFVSAVLAVPSETSGTPYRAQETPIPATFVETRDDRVLRFEHLRAALVDVIGYGAFFATAIAAALVSR